MRAIAVVLPDGSTRRDRRLDGAAGHGSAVAAEVLVGPINPLHRHAERLRLAVRRDFDRLEIVRADVGPAYQGIAALRVMTLSPRSAEIGMQVDVGEADLRGELAIRAGNVVEDAGVEPTTSILLTASTTWRMPISETM